MKPNEIMKVLIAYDGSAQANAALEEMAHAGLPSSAEATVLSVADVWLPPDLADSAEKGLPAAEGSNYPAVQAVKAARRLAEEAAERLRARHPQWIVHPLACADSPPWAIVRHAQTLGTDLVVVGAHSHSVLERFFLGSVALKAVVEVPCSVRVARPRARADHKDLRLIVAVDGSHDSIRAVRAVAERAWPADSKWRVMTIIEPKLRTAATWPGVYPESWAVENAAGVKEWADRMTEHLAAMLRRAGCQTETEIYDGDPKNVLLQQAEAWKADCIFLGARGLHHGSRAYLGSLACAVASRAHCSVEIVRERVPARPAGQTNHDEIARRAYQIWEERGRPSGCDMEMWLEAEGQLRRAP